eukprot:328980_1
MSMDVTEHSNIINISGSSQNNLSHSLLDSSTRSIDYNSFNSRSTLRTPKSFNFKSILSLLNHKNELESTLFRYNKDCQFHISWYSILNNPIYHILITCLSLLYWICRVLVLMDFYNNSNYIYFWISLVMSLTSQLPMSTIGWKYISDRFHFENHLTSLGTLIIIIFASIICIELGPFVPIIIYYMRRYKNFNHSDTAHIYESHRGFLYQAVAEALPQSVVLTVKILAFGAIDSDIFSHMILYISLLICIIFIVLIIFVLCFLGVLYGNIKSSMCIFVVFTIDLLQLFVILIFLYQNFSNVTIVIIWFIYTILAIGISAFCLSMSIILLFTEEVKQSMNDFHLINKILFIICVLIIAIICIFVLFSMILIFSCGLSYIWIWIILMAIDTPMYEIHARGQFSQWITNNKCNNNNKKISPIYKLYCLNSLIINTLHSNNKNVNDLSTSKQYLLKNSIDLFKNVSLKEFRKTYTELSIMRRLDKEVLGSLLISKNENKTLHYIQKYSVFWYIFMRIPYMFVP